MRCVGRELREGLGGAGRSAGVPPALTVLEGAKGIGKGRGAGTLRSSTALQRRSPALQGRGGDAANGKSGGLP
jgi:hypothetical protein